MTKQKFKERLSNLEKCGWMVIDYIPSKKYAVLTKDNITMELK